MRLSMSSDYGLGAGQALKIAERLDGSITADGERRWRGALTQTRPELSSSSCRTNNGSAEQGTKPSDDESEKE